MDEQLERIALFLGQYFTVDEGIQYLRDPTVQRDAIHRLIQDEIMTEAEIRLEAARDFSVIIPHEYFIF